jgi:hypothetical protein
MSTPTSGEEKGVSTGDGPNLELDRLSVSEKDVKIFS